MSMPALQARTATRAGVHGAMKLARLLELPEKSFEARVRELEADVRFAELRDAGVVSIQPFSQARFAARQAGRELGFSSAGLPELLDGNGGLARLIARVGRDRFEEYFLAEDALSAEACAQGCAISIDEAHRLKDLVSRLYVQAEFEEPAAPAPMVEAFSAVAGIDVEGGRPVLSFFNREIWKGRYRVDPEKRREFMRSLAPAPARRLEEFLAGLEAVDRRKSTLYAILEIVMERQAEYLAAGEPQRRRALSQREVAERVGADPSVVSRLISNKSVRLPWGLEAPLKALMPSRKDMLKDILHDLAVQNPGWSDEGLREELGRRHAARLSRRSVAQYRAELKLGGQGRGRASS